MNAITANGSHAIRSEGRVLARRLARELDKEEVEAIAGGMMKTHDVHGTACEPWGDLDDGGEGDPYGNP